MPPEPPDAPAPPDRNRFLSVPVPVLCVVVAILLFAVFTPQVSNESWFSSGKGGGSVARERMKELEKALEFFRMDIGRYPDRLDELTVPTYDAPRGYMHSNSLDPWMEPYIYRVTPGSGAYELFSKGRDREAGTEDDICLHRAK